MPALPAEDWLRAGNAENLARAIARYWRARGYEVETYVEEHRQHHGALFCVRSDMVSGMPRTKR